jgi:hypothetical protein
MKSFEHWMCVHPFLRSELRGNIRAWPGKRLSLLCQICLAGSERVGEVLQSLIFGGSSPAYIPVGDVGRIGMQLEAWIFVVCAFRIRFLPTKRNWVVFEFPIWERNDKIHFHEARSWFLSPEIACTAKTYSAASASVWLGNNPAYLVIPTIVNTFTKCGESPYAYTFCPEFDASISSWITSAMPLELM